MTDTTKNINVRNILINIFLFIVRTSDRILSWFETKYIPRPTQPSKVDIKPNPATDYTLAGNQKTISTTTTEEKRTEYN